MRKLLLIITIKLSVSIFSVADYCTLKHCRQCKVRSYEIWSGPVSINLCDWTVWNTTARICPLGQNGWCKQVPRHYLLTLHQRLQTTVVDKPSTAVTQSASLCVYQQLTSADIPSIYSYSLDQKGFLRGPDSILWEMWISKSGFHLSPVYCPSLV